VISRNFLISIVVLILGAAIGYMVSRGIIGALSIGYHQKNLSMLEGPTASHGPAPAGMKLRMVDMGGVGVVPDTSGWGVNYEHNQHFFEKVMLDASPYLDSAEFARERSHLEMYAGKMSGWGYNAISMPFFLEFINFDLVGDGREVYGDQSIYRDRHDSLVAGFSELMDVSAGQGLSTYLWTDMVALTTPLENYFRRRFGSVEPESESLWEVYQLGVEELFENFPELEGIILRIGEAGSIYNKPGWDYRSELLVRTATAVELMLNAFLRAAEKYDRTIIFRTWSVGVGQIGDMHTNPDTYQKVLGKIHSNHLIVSTKYCAGDFYSWLPLNPTFLTGDHRRMVEIQAKREFEGFGSFPNYVGPLHQRAVQALLETNPLVEGAWVWTQYGGPLRAGPMIIYPFYGFNVINDLNVYAVSRILQEPYAPIDSISSEWVRDYFGSDTTLVREVVASMNGSYPVMLQGLYISQFAKYKVHAMGLEPPPMLWIFEWDILGASSSVFSNIYFITRAQYQQVLDEGFEAVRGAVVMKEKLLAVQHLVTTHEEAYEQLISAVDYEIELFRLLDYYRQFMIHYYRWIDTGDRHSRTAFQLAMGQFAAVSDFHQEKYGGDLNTLGIDLEEAGQGSVIAGNAFATIRWARVYLVMLFFLLLMGIPGFIRTLGHRKFAASLFFDTLFRPHLISSLNSYHSIRRLLLIMGTLYLLSFVIFSAFAAVWFPAVAGVLSLFYCLVLGIAISGGRNLARVLVTLLAPRLLIMALFMAAIAVRGTGYFWYLFWTSDLFKIGFFILLFVLVFRKYHVYIIAGKKWGHRRGAGSFAAVFLVMGLQLLLAGAMLQFFGLEHSLTVLNNELLVLPGGLSKIMGITTHLGIPLDLPRWIILAASAMVLIFLMVLLRERQIRLRTL
jgi:hypothetical protein